MDLRFHPKLLDTLPGYSRLQALQDISAGLTVGVLALPLAMAFAIASGMPPGAGIWTAIVAGFLISALGGSRVQIGGPTGAFIPIVFGIVADYGVANLLVATLLAGAMLLAMGLARLGSLVRYIPVSVVIGFTNGIAVVIFLSQIKDFLGLQTGALPGDFFGRIALLTRHLHTVHPPTLALGCASLAVLLAWNRGAEHVRWMARLPGPLAVLVLATAANALFALPVDTIGSRFGGIPQGLPELALPALSLDKLSKLISPALTIALLGAIESLLSARVADGRIDDRHDPNQELVAQGLANLAAPLFGGFAATGAIARTATNIRSGGRTPIAGIVHAATLLAVVLAAAPLARHVPLATLAAIVLLVSVNMGEWHAFRELRRYTNNYRAILLSTFIVTVVFDLTLAVELGMVLASLLFIARVSGLSRLEPVAVSVASSRRLEAWRAHGSIFFGSADKIEALALRNGPWPEVLILDLSKVINVDTTGLEAIQNLYRDLVRHGGRLVLCGVGSQPASLLARSGFAERLGRPGIAHDLDQALAQEGARRAETAPPR